MLPVMFPHFVYVEPAGICATNEGMGNRNPHQDHDYEWPARPGTGDMGIS